MLTGTTYKKLALLALSSISFEVMGMMSKGNNFSSTGDWKNSESHQNFQSKKNEYVTEIKKQKNEKILNKKRIGFIEQSEQLEKQKQLEMQQHNHQLEIAKATINGNTLITPDHINPLLQYQKENVGHPTYNDGLVSNALALLIAKEIIGVGVHEADNKEATLLLGYQNENISNPTNNDKLVSYALQLLGDKLVVDYSTQAALPFYIKSLEIDPYNMDMQDYFATHLNNKVISYGLCKSEILQHLFNLKFFCSKLH